MVQAIGIMIGGYILARVIEMMDLPKPVIRIAAALAGLLAIGMMLRVLTTEGVGW
jgi:hypothetical protein